MKHFFILAAAVFLLIACEEEMKPPSGSEEQPPTENEDSTVPDTDPTPEPVTARVSGLNGDCGDFCIMLLTTGRGLTTDPSYEIPGFNCTKEDPEYIGFNISELIADYIPATDLPIENEKMKPYSFRIVRWNDDVKSISYEDTGSEITCLTHCK